LWKLYCLLSVFDGLSKHTNTIITLSQ
jgi:hypothetical protein